MCCPQQCWFVGSWVLHCAGAGGGLASLAGTVLMQYFRSHSNFGTSFVIKVRRLTAVCADCADGAVGSVVAWALHYPFVLTLLFLCFPFSILFVCGQPLGLGRGWCVPGGVGSRLVALPFSSLDSLGRALGEVALCVLILPGLLCCWGPWGPYAVSYLLMGAVVN